MEKITYPDYKNQKARIYYLTDMRAFLREWPMSQKGAEDSRNYRLPAEREEI